MKEKILVIGSGAWGSAIANLIAQNSYQVFLSAVEKNIVEEINSKHTNQAFLPNIKLSPKIKAIEDFSGIISSCDFVFIVTPSPASAEVFSKIAQAKIKKSCKFIICSKGLEQGSLMLLSDAFEKITGNKNYTVLSGPNFALEVANKTPTVTSIASKNKKIAQAVIKILNNDYFSATYFNDPRTAEICGIVKNIIAIGCGMADGIGLGVNGKSALLIKGIEEIQILCKKFKASPNLSSPAGFGDIFLTCSSAKSRNNSLGSLIAQGKSYKEIVKETGNTYEGVASAKSVAILAKKLKLRLILCETIDQIISNHFSPKQIKEKLLKAIIQ